ncbi:MAG: GNAT family N-acetyltransferase [Planctomycetes bacterium]|nr:GNAT family N-acetyltransferase [Planctomycetota bacterium]
MPAMSTDYAIRTALPEDREELGDLIDAAFVQDGFRCRARLPHLFTAERIGEHRVASADGRLVGCVGCYSVELRVDGMAFTAAGIGQVVTAPAQRGSGVMRQLMEATCAHAEDFDLLWLHGDHQRYARFGFAPGGLTWEMDTAHRYLPAAPGSTRQATSAADWRLVAAAARRQRVHLEVADQDFAEIMRARDCSAWLGDGAVAMSYQGAHRIVLCDGEPEALAGLFADILADIQRGDPARQTLNVRLDPADARTPALLRCFQHDVRGLPSGSFRVGSARTLAAKLTALAHAAGDIERAQLISRAFDVAYGDDYARAQRVFGLSPGWAGWASPTQACLLPLSLPPGSWV